MPLGENQDALLWLVKRVHDLMETIEADLTKITSTLILGKPSNDPARTRPRRARCCKAAHGLRRACLVEKPAVRSRRMKPANGGQVWRGRCAAPAFSFRGMVFDG
jgi:hypothetical protein